MRRKRLEGLQFELARPFEHEGRLSALLVRQRELLKQLHLDKDEAGSAGLDGEAMRHGCMNSCPTTARWWGAFSFLGSGA